MKQEMPSIANLHKGTIRLQLKLSRLMVPLVPIPNGSTTKMRFDYRLILQVLRLHIVVSL